MDNEWGNKKPANKLNSHIVIGGLHEACVFVCEHVVGNLIQFGRKKRKRKKKQRLNNHQSQMWIAKRDGTHTSKPIEILANLISQKQVCNEKHPHKN